MTKKAKGGTTKVSKRAAAKTVAKKASAKGPKVIGATDWCRPPKPPGKPKK